MPFFQQINQNLFTKTFKSDKNCLVKITSKFNKNNLNKISLDKKNKSPNYYV